MKVGLGLALAACLTGIVPVLPAGRPGVLGPDANDPSTTTHVAIYLGNDQILEAAPPRDTSSVHIAALGSHG
jgi:hypothetical protein